MNIKRVIIGEFAVEFLELPKLIYTYLVIPLGSKLSSFLPYDQPFLRYSRIKIWVSDNRGSQCWTSHFGQNGIYPNPYSPWGSN